MTNYSEKITDAQYKLARLFEKYGIATYSQAVKAFARQENQKIENWKKELSKKMGGENGQGNI